MSTLLLSSSYPGQLGVGGLLIGEMLGCDGVPPVVLTALCSSGDPQTVDPSHLKDFLFLTSPVEAHPTALTSRVQHLRNRLRQKQKVDPAVQRLLPQLKSWIETHQPKQLWAILDSTTIIDVVFHLAPQLSCPLIVQIWDDPLHLCIQRNYDALTKKRTVTRFQTILRQASRIGVICEAMQAAYQDTCPGDYVIIRHGIQRHENEVIPQFEAPHPGEFRIGLAGSMYSIASWRVLQSTLDELDWTLDGRQVVLEVAGSRIEFHSQAKASCRFYGWRNPQEIHQQMMACDVCYMPQAFEPQYAPLTELSFPTKFSTYAATGRPILVHTPPNGSLTPFCAEQNIKLVCNTLNQNELSGLLHRVAEDPEFRKSEAEASAEVANKVLTFSAFSSGVRTLLGDEPSK